MLFRSAARDARAEVMERRVVVLGRAVGGYEALGAVAVLGGDDSGAQVVAAAGELEPGRGFLACLLRGKSRNQGELGGAEALTPIMKHPLARTCACQTPAKWPAAVGCSRQRLPLRAPALVLAGFSPKTDQIRAETGRNPANGLTRISEDRRPRSHRNV